MVETSDIMFALDSVPAAFGVTQNIPIIFLANIFAICGLRNLYFVLEVVKDKFESVKHGIALILVLIGLKMVFGQFIHISEIATMAIILSILVGTVVISVITNKVKGEK
jgi:tellurite resistance protein TerC